MIAAVDTNILLDVLDPDPRFAEASEAQLVAALGAGPVVISDLVYSELAAHFERAEELEVFLRTAGIRLSSMGTDALQMAGNAWRSYTRRRPEGFTCGSCGAVSQLSCGQCGETIRARQHMLADFLIGAHALMHADRLLTRDQSFYARYYPDLVLA